MADPKVIKFSKVFDPESIPESEATFKDPDMAQEMARRWNLHEELIEALDECVSDVKEISGPEWADKLTELITRAKGGI